MKRTPSGLYLGWDRRSNDYFVNDEDTHSLIIGATRCGKTRCNVLQTVVLQALAGESIVAVDPKGELYGYTCELLRTLDYEVVCIDFKNPARSSRYNFLQPVLDAVLLGNLPQAAQRARDIAAMLVPQNEKTSVDPIWDDGQRAILTTGILAVCLECPDPDQQNLSNVREFLAQMCAPRNGELPLTHYLDDLPSDSPLQAAMGIARIAPEKMRGSFYTSALATLDLFSDPNIYGMSAVTDFDYAATGNRKRAIFLSLPDERTAYYPIAALFVYEMYQALVAVADQNGGRLPLRVNFDCDEFGNFVRVPDFDKFITVGGGRGIRFNLYVQDTNQIYQHYGDMTGKTILANCENWLYMQTENLDTVEEVSRRLGNYTIRTPNISSSSSSSGGSYSGGYSLTGRRLLMPEEIKRIDRPWQLLSARGGRHKIMYAPDISQMPFNALLGMGSPEHNQALLMRRWDARPERQFTPIYWEVWKPYVAACTKPGK